MGALKVTATVVSLSVILVLLIRPTHAGSSFTTNPDIFDELEEDPSGRRTLPPRGDWEAAIADLVSRYRHLIMEILGDTSNRTAEQDRRSTTPPPLPPTAGETEMSQSQIRTVINRYRQLILHFLRREEATDRAGHNVSRAPGATGGTEGK